MFLLRKSIPEAILSRISVQVAYRNNAKNPNFLSFSTTSDTRFFPIANKADYKPVLFL